jgi:hypothetical protein
VDAPDAADDTPLLLAARMAGPDTVAALLAAGADVRAVNKLGMTALCEAAVVRERSDVAEVLTGHGGVDPAEERVNGGYTLMAGVELFPIVPHATSFHRPPSTVHRPPSTVVLCCVVLCGCCCAIPCDVVLSLCCLLV